VTDSIIYIIVTGIFIHWVELTGSDSPFSEKRKKSIRAGSRQSEKRCIGEEYRENQQWEFCYNLK